MFVPAVGGTTEYPFVVSRLIVNVTAEDSRGRLLASGPPSDKDISFAFLFPALYVGRCGLSSGSESIVRSIIDVRTGADLAGAGGLDDDEDEPFLTKPLLGRR